MSGHHDSSGGIAHRWGQTFLVAGIAVVASVELGAVNALFPVLRRVFGLTTSQLGLMTTLAVLARMIMGPCWGILADRLGRRRMLLVACTLCCACLFGGAAARSYPVFVTLYALGAIGAVAAEPIVDSLLSDYFAPSERGKGFGTVRALASLGLGVFMPILGWLSTSSDGWRVAFLLMAGLQVSALVLAATVLREPSRRTLPLQRVPGARPARATTDALRRLIKIPSVRLLAINYMLATSIVMWSFLPTFISEVRGYSVDVATRLFGVMRVGAVIGSVLGGLLGDWAARRHPARGRIVVMQVYLVTFVLMSLLVFQAPWRGPIYVHSLLFCFGVIFPIGFSGAVLPIVSHVIAPELRGTGFGLLASFTQGLSLAIVSSIVGVLADHYGLQRMLFWAVTMPYLLNTFVWFFMYRTYPDDSAAVRRELEARELASGR